MRKFEKLTEKIIAEVSNIIEKELNEISSTTFYDAADKADMYNNRTLAKKFRDAGEKRRKEELDKEYDEAIVEYGRYVHQPYENKAAKTFIVAKYMPSNMPILILLKDVARAQIARVGHDRLINIADKELASEIAGHYNRNAVEKDNITSMSVVIGKDRKAANELADMINNAFDSEISWRYFFGDSFEKRATRDTTKDYVPWGAPFAVGGMYVSMAKSATKQTSYDIYYILFTTQNKTAHMARVFKDMKAIRALGNKQPGSVWSAMCKFSINGKELVPQNEKTGERYRPTPDSSDIVNIYPVLQSLSPDAQHEIFRILSWHLGFKLTIQNFYDTYAKAMGIETLKVKENDVTSFSFDDADNAAPKEPVVSKAEVKDFDSAFDNSDDYEDVEEVNVDAFEEPADEVVDNDMSDEVSDKDYPAYDEVEIDNDESEETKVEVKNDVKNNKDDFDFDLDLDSYEDLDFDEEFKK